MLNIAENSKSSIYVGEKRSMPLFGDGRHYYHAFLMLVDETGEAPIVLQQLHYNDDDDGNIYPNLREGIFRPESFKNVMGAPLVGGSALHVLNMWNHGLAYASQVKEGPSIAFGKNYMFDHDDANCRTGVIATQKAMGLTPHVEFFAQEAGTLSEAFKVIASFDHSVNTEMTLEELVKQNLDFVLNMKLDFLPDEDPYVGPLSQPFQPMKKMI